MKKTTLRQLTSGACVWALIAGSLMAAPALAQAPTAETTQTFDLPAQDLNQALLQFAQSAGLQVFYDAKLVEGRQSSALNGRYTPRQALSRLLAGTGLNYTISGNTVRLSQTQAVGDGMNLGTIRVQGDGVAGEAGEAGTPLAYEMGDAIDTGTSLMPREAIEARQNGNGDVNQTLKILPHVYFSNNESRATDENIQDLRPSEISIAGSQPYENSFILDGVAANSRLDTMSSNSDNPAHYDNTAGASAETLWIDSSLVDSIVVRDSNVSARYGGFTGGVVEIDTRNPRRDYGATLYRSCTSDDLVSFKIDEKTRAALGDNIPAKPDYKRCRTGLSLDLPISERVRTLIGLSEQENVLTYYKVAAYGGTPYGLKSRSRNVLAKIEADLTPNLLLTGQYSYSPYEQEFENENQLEARLVTRGGGQSGKIGLKNRNGVSRWTLDLTYAQSDTSRTAPATFYSWPVSIAGALCASTNCSFGGFGSIDQTQEDVTLKGTFNRPLGQGTLTGGFDLSHTEVRKHRPEDNASYRLFTSNAAALPQFRAANFVGANIICAPGDNLCIPGKGVLNNRMVYPAYDITVDVDTYSLWAEYALTRGALSLRTGLRYDRESILDNNNFAPRLTASYDFPWVTATIGANRYYHQSFLGYAIQAASNRSYTYRRTTSLVNGNRLAGDWYLHDVTTNYTYDGIALKTPYSDELTIAFTREVLGGNGRLKFISRRYKDQVTRSETTDTGSFTSPDGQTLTYAIRKPANEGRSQYDGVSVEWGRSFGRHTVTFSGNWAETKTNLDADNTYMDFSGSSEYEGDLVYYAGAVRNLLEVMAENDRLDFAAPGLANLDWSAHWLGGRLRTNLNARWRADFEQLEDTGVNIRVDGSNYDVWDVVHYDDSVAVNGGFDTDIVKRGRNIVTLEIKATNLFDTLPKITGTTSTSQPYRFGRAFWVGIKYKY